MQVQRHLRLTVYILLLVLCLIPIQALGHTQLMEINPKPNSQLEVSPALVELLFNQKLEAITEESIVLKDDAGKPLATGPVESGAEGKSAHVDLPVLSKGTYTVNYHVMSIDGHMVKGNYAFTVLSDIEEARSTEPPKLEAPAATPAEHNYSETLIEMIPDYEAVPMETDRSMGELWTALFTETEAADLLGMAYFVIFLLLVGMLIWYVLLWRGRSEEDSRRHHNWILQIQRIHVLVLIALIAEFIQHTVGFGDWQSVRHVMLNTTAGASWSVLLLLSLLGLVVLHRNRFIDIVWILAIVVTKTQIGHPAASDYRFVVSALTSIHILAAATWVGGLAYLMLLWSRYRHVAERLILKLSNASLIAISLLTLSGIASSLLYLSELSYIFETRWGMLLMLKVVVVIVVIGIGALIRGRFVRDGLLHVSAWIKLDFMLLVVIASLAALLTAAEPNPSNEPLHWHVMGDVIHMTAEITPKTPGDNRMAVSVWLPEDSGEPKAVSMLIAREPDRHRKTIAFTKVNGSNEYGFIGFNEFIYQTESDLLDQAGNWLIEIIVTDQMDQSWSYKKLIRVY